MIFKQVIVNYYFIAFMLLTIFASVDDIYHKRPFLTKPLKLFTRQCSDQNYTLQTVLFSWNVSCFWKHSYRQKKLLLALFSLIHELFFSALLDLRCWSCFSHSSSLQYFIVYYWHSARNSPPVTLSLLLWAKMAKCIYIFILPIIQIMWENVRDQQKNVINITLLRSLFFISTSVSLPFHSFFWHSISPFHRPLTGNGKMYFFHSIAPSSRECTCIDLITTGWH